MRKVIILFFAITIIISFNVNIAKSQVTDIDGNIYKTVTIGNLEWTSENLNVSCYRNGDVIPQVQDKEEWKNLSSGAWCYYQNDSAKGGTFGKLYNWFAINDPRGLAPEGWHIPSDSEWAQTVDFVGGYLVAGAKFKSTELFKSPNKGATNETGFTAIPSGIRYDVGEFNFLNEFCYLWTSSEFDSATSWARLLSFGNTVVFRFNAYKQDGYAVRCVKN